MKNISNRIEKMRHMPKLCVISMGLFMLSIEPSFARASLTNDARITNELTIAAVGDEIRKNCPSISARRMRVMSKAFALRDYAMSLGYSSEEITDFIKDKSERARIFGLRDQYLSKNGVKKGDAMSYCRLGESEISKGSLLGDLLKKN